ncbi:hypothetical protein [uncultured Rhodoferax sp.]|uniref:hypothetical protein n=1 Tax=uncultured Rhodoferax sp. TaxID=223188 RepID=UPI0025DF60B8|nr:hypothetical protein [uncultured Rhodoferax sp.]
MRALLIAPLMALFVSAQAAESVSVDFRCMATSGSKPIRLEWRLFSEGKSNWSASYVKYKGAKQPISLVLHTTSASETAPGRPMEFESVWLEVVDGQIAGEYRITTQGANVYGFDYKNRRTGKEIAFAQDNAAYTETGCKWN